MDVNKVEKAILEIVEKKKTLSKLTYNDNTYDKVEEELHDLEDEFMDLFGDELEEALEEVHNTFCADTDVLMPIAYISGNYKKVTDTGYDIEQGEGVLVESEQMPGKNTRVVIVPGPLRIVLTNGKDKKEVWKAKA